MSTTTEKGIRLHDSGSFWFLEGFLGESRMRWRAGLGTLPTQIGRHPTLAEVRLPSHRVSALHARIYESGGSLWIRDLDSRNGTYLNGRRIVEDRRLSIGDHVQFADLEFRIGLHQAGSQTRSSIDGCELEELLVGRTVALEAMLCSNEGAAHFQPIVALGQEGSESFELLSRAELDGSSTSPAELFYLAERVGAEARLSRWLRDTGLQEMDRFASEARIFVNTHPAELADLPGFLRDVAAAKRRAPSIQLVVEVHETAFESSSMFRELRLALHDLDVLLSIDDFGSGEAGLRSISSANPDYIKFDMGWIRGIHRASHRRRLLGDLVSATRDLGIVSVAEGVEEPEELDVCRDLRFDLAQGFFLGLPQPKPAISKSAAVPVGADSVEPEEGLPLPIAWQLP